MSFLTRLRAVVSCSNCAFTGAELRNNKSPSHFNNILNPITIIDKENSRYKIIKILIESVIRKINNHCDFELKNYEIGDEL